MLDGHSSSRSMKTLEDNDCTGCAGDTVRMPLAFRLDGKTVSFAGSTNKAEQKCEHFYSKYATPGDVCRHCAESVQLPACVFKIICGVLFVVG